MTFPANFFKAALLIKLCGFLIATSLAATEPGASTDDPIHRTLLEKLNTADLEVLAGIRGIGPVRAATIRKHRPFKAVEELILLPGFGAKTVETISNHRPKLDEP